MALPNWFIPFFGTLLILVLFHELGHFITAKLAGVTVQEFGFGYPPRLAGFRFRGTLYSLNLLPLGGFVKMLGEEDPAERGSFASRPGWVRFIILAAGPFMNAVLPIALLSAGLILPHQAMQGQVVIQEVAPGSPAEAAGLQPGDVVVRVNDREIREIGDVAYNIQLNLGSPLDITIRRPAAGLGIPGGRPGPAETKVVRVEPRWNPPPGQGPTGIKIGPSPDAQIITTSLPPLEALGEATQRTLDMPGLFKNGMYAMVAGNDGAAVTGPIGIAQATGEVAQAGFPPLLEWAAFLSMNLAILNILPIPALDGGRILFVLIEWIRRGRRIPPEREGFVHAVGFAILIAGIVVVSVNDITRLINGQNLVP